MGTSAEACAGWRLKCAGRCCRCGVVRWMLSIGCGVAAAAAGDDCSRWLRCLTAGRRGSSVSDLVAGTISCQYSMCGWQSWCYEHNTFHWPSFTVTAMFWAITCPYVITPSMQ
jgi:hypothetical protein